MSTKPSFSECLARCREYGQDKTKEVREKQKGEVRRQLAETKENYHKEMIRTDEMLQKGERPGTSCYTGLYYEENGSMVQIQNLYGDMIKWVVENRAQLLKEAFSEVNVVVVDYSVYEEGNCVNIWFILCDKTVSQVTMRKERYLELDPNKIIIMADTEE